MMTELFHSQNLSMSSTNLQIFQGNSIKEVNFELKGEKNIYSEDLTINEYLELRFDNDAIQIIIIP